MFMKYGILMHEPNDDVGVAVADLEAGVEVGAATLEGQPVGSVTLLQAIPLGHKIALRDLKAGQKVMEYGRPIGAATQDIARGAHVHVHNLKTLRWSK
jgi:(2R)-sulfolactate sulfo-lyase subunit alpha